MENFSAITIDKYLNLLEEAALLAPKSKDDGALFLKVEEVLKEFRSLDCSTCGSHYGYQHRRDPSIKLCSSRCLAIVKQKLRVQGSVGVGLCDLGTVRIPETPDSPDSDPSDSEPSTSEFLPSHALISCQVSKPQEPSSSSPGSSMSHSQVEKTDLQKEERCDKSLKSDLENTATSSPVADASSTVAADARTEANLMTKPEAGVIQSPKMVPVAVTLKGKTSQDKIKKIWNLDDVSLSPALVDKAPCVVSFSWGQAKVTINAESDLARLDKLQSEIADYVNGGGAKPLTISPDRDSLPCDNEIVLAPYDGVIYRGRVVKGTSSKGNVLVEFIDFGDVELVKVEDCFEPSDKIMTEHPMYGLTFTLKTFSPFPQDLVYNAELSNIVEDGKFYLQTDGPEPRKLDWVGSLLLDEEVEGKKTLNVVLDQFILKDSQPAAKSPQPAAVDLLPTIAEADVEELSESAPPKVKEDPAPQPVSPAVEIPGIKSKESAAPESESSTKLAAPSPAPVPAPAPAPATRRFTNPFTGRSKLKKTIHNSIVSPNIKHEALVRINFAWNDALISISSVKDDADIASLDEAIAKHVETAPGLTSMPAIDEIVLAPYLGLYYRGRVTSLEGDEVQVRFVDYGADSQGPYKALKGLNLDIAGHPIYGAVFRMADVPDTKKLSENHPEISAALESGGQIELVDTGKKLPGELTGNLWLGDIRSWNDVVLEIMEAQEG